MSPIPCLNSVRGGNGSKRRGTQFRMPELSSKLCIANDAGSALANAEVSFSPSPKSPKSSKSSPPSATFPATGALNSKSSSPPNASSANWRSDSLGDGTEKVDDPGSFFEEELESCVLGVAQTAASNPKSSIRGGSREASASRVGIACRSQRVERV